LSFASMTRAPTWRRSMMTADLSHAIAQMEWLTWIIGD
jgi:hypothetical protein